MLLHHAPASPPQADAKMVRIGVGIDTSRYGHYAAFLRDDLQPAAGELQFVESAATKRQDVAPIRLGPSPSRRNAGFERSMEIAS